MILSINQYYSEKIKRENLYNFGAFWLYRQR